MNESGHVAVLVQLNSMRDLYDLIRATKSNENTRRNIADIVHGRPNRRPPPKQSQQRRNSQRTFRPVRNIQEEFDLYEPNDTNHHDPTYPDHNEVMALQHVENDLVQGRPLMHVHAKVAHTRVSTLVDTGASASVMGKNTMRKLGLALQHSEHSLTGFSGQGSSTLGFSTAPVTIGPHTSEKTFHGIDMDIETIISERLLARLHFIIDPGKDESICKQTGAIIACHTIKHIPKMLVPKWDIQLQPNTSIPLCQVNSGSRYELSLPTVAIVLPGCKTILDTTISHQISPGCTAMIAGCLDENLNNNLVIYTGLSSTSSTLVPIKILCEAMESRPL